MSVFVVVLLLLLRLLLLLLFLLLLLLRLFFSFLFLNFFVPVARMSYTKSYSLRSFPMLLFLC